MCARFFWQVIAFVFLSFFTNSVAADEWKTIASNERHLLFGLEKIANLTRTTKRRYRNNSQSREEWSSFSDADGRQVFQTYVYELQGGYVLTRSIDIDTAMNLFNNLKSLPRPEVHESFNGLNRAKYGFFDLHGKSCVVIFQNFSASSANDRGDEGTAYLSGFYCDADGNKISKEKATSLIKAIGFVDISGPMLTSSEENIWKSSGGSSDVASQRSIKSVVQANSSSESSSKNTPIVFLWDSGARGLGKMTISPDQNRGRIKLDFLENEADVTCSGSWQHVSGSYGTDKLPTGTWAIACKNGKTATGTYVSHKRMHGKCSGQDDVGRSVTCIF